MAVWTGRLRNDVLHRCETRLFEETKYLALCVHCPFRRLVGPCVSHLSKMQLHVAESRNILRLPHQETKTEPYQRQKPSPCNDDL